MEPSLIGKPSVVENQVEEYEVPSLVQIKPITNTFSNLKKWKLLQNMGSCRFFSDG